MDLFATCTSNLNSSKSKSVLCNEPPEIKDVHNFPELFTGDSLLELCNSFWMPSPGAKKDVQPYLRGCKWSPDGTCCLSVVNRDGFHVMELPQDLYEGCPSHDRMITLLPAVIHVKESGLVYDFCWYPKMNSHNPETCSWISTKINSPIQMWDAYNGSLRCSYRGYNAVDEMEPAISVSFINCGERIVGGYKDCLRTFDVERPGREFIEHKTKSPASCFATHGNLLAVGSWSANIKLFSITNNGTYRSIANLHAHTGGITHLQFTPDGNMIVSGARKDHNLCVWDVRYHRRPLNILKRVVSTNQRIYFDISNCGRYLVSGGTDGVIRIWDNKFTRWTEQLNVKHGNQENATFRFRLYRDCCNSVSIHPSRPILATGSGQYHFKDPVKILEFECDKSTNCEEATIKYQSASDSSTSNEQVLVEADVTSSLNKTDSENGVDVQVAEGHTFTDVHIIDTTKRNTDKVLDHNIAENSISERNTLENSEEPPAKKLKQSNDTKSMTAEEIVDTETPAMLLEDNNINLPNQENIYEHFSQNEASSVVERATEEEHLSSDLKNVTVNKLTFYTNEDDSLAFAKASEVTNVCLDRSGSKSVINIDVQPPSNLTKSVEKDADSNKPNIRLSTEKLYKDSEQGTQIESDISNNSYSLVEKNDTNIQLENLRDTDRSFSNTSNTRYVEKLSTNKHVLDNASECDNDDIENKIKYSSYAENNLTFWWIGKIFEKHLT